MKLLKYLKTLAQIVATYSVAQYTSAQPLEYRNVFEIRCPCLTDTEMEENNWQSGFMTSDVLESYGLKSTNDTAILGNSQWTLVPYSYSSSEQKDIIRDGNYYFSQDSSYIPMASVCVFFEQKETMHSRIVSEGYPTEMECYYKFHRDESHLAREGIDGFGLRTKLRGKISAGEFKSDLVVRKSTNIINGYYPIIGSSVYDEHPYKCGGMRQIPYREVVGGCNDGSWWGFCDLKATIPSIPDGKLQGMNLTSVNCEAKSEETQQTKSQTDVIPVSKFFNKTDCNCNCNCNINVNVGDEPEENTGKKPKKPKKKQCTIL